jgi:hypothetical protein
VLVVDSGCLEAIKSALEYVLPKRAENDLFSVAATNLLADAVIITVKKDGPDPHKNRCCDLGFVPMLAELLADDDVDLGIRFFATGLVRNLARLDLVSMKEGIPTLLVKQLDHELKPIKLCTMSCMINIVLREENSSEIIKFVY